MRSLVSFLVLLLVAVVHAASSSGDRLLVILEDVSQKADYSKFLGDLEGMYPSVSNWKLAAYLPELPRQVRIATYLATS